MAQRLEQVERWSSGCSTGLTRAVTDAPARLSAGGVGAVSWERRAAALSMGPLRNLDLFGHVYSEASQSDVRQAPAAGGPAGTARVDLRRKVQRSSDRDHVERPAVSCSRSWPPVNAEFETAPGQQGRSTGRSSGSAARSSWPLLPGHGDRRPGHAVEPGIEVVFLDTEAHFPETLAMVESVRGTATAST